MSVGWDLIPYPVLHQFFENGTVLCFSDLDWKTVEHFCTTVSETSTFSCYCMYSLHPYNCKTWAWHFVAEFAEDTVADKLSLIFFNSLWGTSFELSLQKLKLHCHLQILETVEGRPWAIEPYIFVSLNIVSLNKLSLKKMSLN